MTEQEIKNQIEDLTLELDELNEAKYDKHVFSIQRNNVIGTNIVNIYKSKLEWIGGNSKEDIPQHWLYHLLLIIEKEAPKRFETVCDVLEVTPEEIKNNRPSNYTNLPHQPHELYTFLVGMNALLVKEAQDRTDIGVAIQTALRNAITARRKESIQVAENLKIQQNNLILMQKGKENA